MELHESLYALGLRHGREVFDDPDSFRGALDDFLDEDSATTRDINLLVDAVRLGAFSSMTTMIDSGALVAAAIEEAGKRLARDRGSADVAGAQWACALLGFAIGKVSDAEVRRYRTQHATPQPPSQPLPPTQFPAQQPPSAQEPARPMAPTAPLPARPTSPAASQATSEGVVGKRVPGYGPEERISLDAAVRKALDIEVRLGALGIDVPPLRQGRHDTATVAISRDFDAESTIAGFVAQSQIAEVEQISTSALMFVDVTGPNFRISRLNPPEGEQLVCDTATWEFDLLPLTAGLQHLRVSASMRVPVSGHGDKTVSIPSLERKFKVDVDRLYAGRALLQLHWQWAVTSLLAAAAIIAGIIWR